MSGHDHPVELLRENYPYLAAEYGVSRIGLFGSFASGQADEQSDVDILVELDRPLGFKFFELTDHLERLLGRKVDVLTTAGLQTIRVDRIAESILKSIEYV